MSAELRPNNLTKAKSPKPEALKREPGFGVGLDLGFQA